MEFWSDARLPADACCLGLPAWIYHLHGCLPAFLLSADSLDFWITRYHWIMDSRLGGLESSAGWALPATYHRYRYHSDTILRHSTMLPPPPFLSFSPGFICC